MSKSNLWSRRKFSKAIWSLQMLASSGLLKVTSSCKNDSKNKEVIENPVDHPILKLAMDEIIPNTHGLPSASEAGGLGYINSIFQEYPELSQSLLELLKQLNGISLSNYKTDFENLDRNERIASLKTFELSRTESFEVLKNLIYESYYINETVWKLIGYQPFPTTSTGPQMEPFDETLLHRVKNLPPLYRHES